jgi:hypothetical protein
MVLLTCDGGQTTALVTTNGSQIKIAVNGPQTTSFLTTLVASLEYLLAQFWQRLECVISAVCTCPQCIRNASADLFKLDDIMEIVQRGESILLCMRSGTKVPIQQVTKERNPNARKR